MSGMKTDRQSRAARAETLGLLLIAVAILILVLVRGGGFVPWHVR